MTMRSGRSVMFHHSGATPAQMQRFLELAHHLLEGPSHPVELDIGSATHAVSMTHAGDRPLQHRSFDITAINRRHRFDDFAFGAVGVDALDEMRHQIVFRIAAGTL